MYSPKISEDLIPRVYRAAKQARLHMTSWVNQAVEKSLLEAAHNHKPKERTTAMKRTEPEQSNNRLETENTFVIAKGEAGYRVCSPLTPAKQYVVSGIPNDPQCTCEEFMHPDCPPGWVCGHIQAVLKEIPHLEAEPTSPISPAPAGDQGSIEPPSHNGKNGNGKIPRGRNAKGVVMLLKRSVSPDGRIDSLSVEFSCPVASATTGGIKELAQVILALQGEITAGFLKTSGNTKPHGKNGSEPHSNNGNGNSDVPSDAIPGLLLGVASMNTRRGPWLFLSVLVNERVLKLFGSQKQLAEAVKNAGYANVADRIVDGYTLNLPCRVVTKQNGKYLNVERVYPPAEAAVAARA